MPLDDRGECVLDARAELGECPVWSAHEQALYWVDIRAPALHRLDPGSGATRTWPMPSRIGSFGLRDGVAAPSWRWWTASTCSTSTPAR